MDRSRISHWSDFFSLLRTFMARSALQNLRQHFTTQNRIKETTGYGGKIHALGWNNAGTKLATGSSDKSVNIYQLDSTRLSRLQTFRGHTDSVDQLAWHPSVNDILATVSADSTVRLWDCRSKRITTAQLKGENINLAWSPDGNTIAVGNKSDLISWLDVRTDLKVIQSEQFGCEINEFSWKPSLDLMLFATGTGAIMIYSGKPGEMRRECTLPAHPSNAIADALVSLWDADEFICLRTLTRLEWPVRAMGFSFDNQLIASASEDHFIDIGCVETGDQVYRLGTQAAATFVLAWHPKHLLLTYSSEAKYDRDQGVIRMFGFPSDSDNRKTSNLPVPMDLS
nr:tho complex subunit 3 [Hymenolepis microstoma]